MSVPEQDRRRPRFIVEAQAVRLDAARLAVRQPLDDGWRKVLSLRGRTARYTDRVHALILFLARLRCGRLVIDGSEHGWAPYGRVSQQPGWEHCRDKQRLREALLHELDLVTGQFFQRSPLDGQPRIRIAQPPETIVLDGDAAEVATEKAGEATEGAGRRRNDAADGTLTAVTLDDAEGTLAATTTVGPSEEPRWRRSE